MKLKIRKSGGKYHIDLPKRWLKEKGLTEGDELDAHFNMNQVILRIPRRGTSDLIFGGKK